MDIRHAVGVKVGVSSAKLAGLLDYRDSASFTEREKAALELAERMTRSDMEVSEACLRRVRRHFSEEQLLELVFVVGFQTFASKFAKAYRLSPQGFSPGEAR
jgi:alkylhydroperoxidase family enzyme